MTRHALAITAALLALPVAGQSIRDADTRHMISWSSSDPTVVGFMLLVRPHRQEHAAATVSLMDPATRSIPCTNLFAGLAHGVYEVSAVSVNAAKLASVESPRLILNWTPGPLPVQPGFVQLRQLPTTRSIPAARAIPEQSITLEQLGIAPGAPAPARPTQLSPRAAAQRGSFGGKP
jgi:hypothetical protein